MPGFSSENYRESQNGLALAANITENHKMAWHGKLQKITEWPGFSSENYRESQNGLALAVNITENHRMASQGKLQRIIEWPACL